MKLKNLLLSSIIALAPISQFAAAEGNFFIDADIGQSDLDESGVDDGTLINIGIGYDINSNFAVELSHLDLGSFSTDFGDIDVDGFNLSVIGSIPVSEQVNLFARVGYYDWEASLDNFSSTSDNDFIYGVGVSYDFNENVAGTLAYDSYSLDGTDIDSLSIGIKYSF